MFPDFEHGGNNDNDVNMGDVKKRGRSESGETINANENAEKEASNAKNQRNDLMRISTMFYLRISQKNV